MGDVGDIDLAICSRNELKRHVERRLKDEGRWGEYVARREALRADGVRGAWSVALKSFPPLDGSPLETSLRPRRGRKAEGEDDGRRVRIDVPNRLLKEMAARGEDEPSGESLAAYEEWKDQRDARIANGERIRERLASREARRIAESGSTGDAPAADGGAAAKRAKSVPFGVCDVNPRVFDGKTCSRTAAADWAYENCSFNVKPKDAPSKLAWVLLMDFRKSVSYRQDVYKGILTRAVSREEVKEEKDPEQFEGRREFDILAELKDDGTGGAGDEVAQ